MSTTATKSVQIANTEDGSYDVRKPLPYPWHINRDCSVARQDFWKGQPDRLAGFQTSRDKQVINVLAQDWVDSDNIDVTGMFPVFINSDGSMWNSSYPVMGAEDR